MSRAALAWLTLLLAGRSRAMLRSVCPSVAPVSRALLPLCRGDAADVRDHLPDGHDGSVRSWTTGNKNDAVAISAQLDALGIRALTPSEALRPFVAMAEMGGFGAGDRIRTGDPLLGKHAGQRLGEVAFPNLKMRPKRDRFQMFR